MPRANPSANDFAQTLLDQNFLDTPMLEMASFDFPSGMSGDLELDDLSPDLASLAPLKLERQHGRIYSDCP
jgi:hypothetical protein